MLRWLLRIAIGFAALIVLVIVVVQLVLWSSLPKTMVTGQIEKELGLRVSAQTLETGWLGRTELTDVSLGLPLESNSFLTVKSLTIKHNSLIGLLLGNAISVESIQIDHPNIVIVQDAQGNWNLQQVAQLLARAFGSNSAQQSNSDNTIPKLPTIQLIDGKISVRNNLKQTTTITPLDVTGRPDGALAWKYEISMANSVHLTGRVAPGGNWQHRVTLAVHDFNPLLRNWGIGNTYGTEINGMWIGQFADGKLTGNLSMQQMTARGLPGLGDVSLTGSVDVQSIGDVVTMQPKGIWLKTSLATLPDLGIQSGNIISDATGIHAQAMKVNLLHGMVNLDGQFDPKTQDATLAAAWSGLSLAKKTNQSGSLTASLRQPFANQPVINLDLNSIGTYGEVESSPTSTWNAHIHLTGQGSSWQSIDWIFTAPQLAFTSGTQTFNLANLTAHVSQRIPANQQSPVIELTDLSLPSGANGSTDLSASAMIDFNSRQWNITADDKLRTSFQDEPINVDLELNARGTDTQFDLKNLSLTLADVTIAVDGSYDAARPFNQTDPGPFALHVAILQSSRLQLNSPIKGTVAGDLNIVGDLFRKDADDAKPRVDKDPRFHFRPYLDVNGQLHCTDLIAFNRAIGNIDIKLNGNTATNPGEQPHTLLKTTDFQLFGAPWNFSVIYPDPNSRLEADLQVSHLKLAELANVANVSGISGDVTNAKWVLLATGTDLNSIDIHSEYHLTDVAAPGVTADAVDATATLHDGMLQLNPLIARSGKGSLTTIAAVDLNILQSLTSQTTVTNWPFQLSEVADALVSAQANVLVDLKSSSIGSSGTITASTDVVQHQKEKTVTIAHVDLDADLRNRAIDVNTLSGTVQHGTFNGEAKVDFDKPLLATGFVQWNDIDGSSLADVIPALDGLAGKFSGTVNIAPALREQRPLEPVRVDISLVSDHGKFRSIKIGGAGLPPMRAVAYVNTDRAVLDQSDLYLANGTVHLWSRISSKGGLSDQTLVDFDSLDLNQLVHVDPTVRDSTPGILSGHLGFVRSGTGGNKLLAIGHINLEKTDLAHIGPIAALYDLMKVGRAGSQPNGYGSVDLAFEQNMLRVTSFRFFNRGVDARGLLAMGPINYHNVGLTPIGGQIAGAARPLKDIRLPLLDDFDDAFTALQTNLTTVNINGPLGKPKYQQATIADIGSALRQLLVGDAEASQQAGQ